MGHCPSSDTLEEHNEAGTYSSRVVGVLFRALPFINDFDVWSYPLTTEASSFGTNGHQHRSGSSAEQRTPLVWNQPWCEGCYLLCPKLLCTHQNSSASVPLGMGNQHAADGMIKTCISVCCVTSFPEQRKICGSFAAPGNSCQSQGWSRNNGPTTEQAPSLGTTGFAWALWF